MWDLDLDKLEKDVGDGLATLSFKPGIPLGDLSASELQDVTGLTLTIPPDRLHRVTYSELIYDYRGLQK